MTKEREQRRRIVETISLLIETINTLIDNDLKIKRSMLIIVDIMADLHDRVAKLESESDVSDADDERRQIEL